MSGDVIREAAPLDLLDSRAIEGRLLSCCAPTQRPNDP